MRRRPIIAWGRAIIGMVALYGLVLKALLASAAPILPADLAGMICAHDGSAAPSSDQPIRHDHSCCTVAAHAGLASPVMDATVQVLTPPVLIEVAWRPEASLLRTGPPARSHRPRGPPLV